MEHQHEDEAASAPWSYDPSQSTPYTPEKSTPTHRRSVSDQIGRPSFSGSTLDRIPFDPIYPVREGHKTPGTMRETPFPLSPNASDRVFPIRSVISVDPMPTPMARGPSGDGYLFGQPPMSEASHVRWSNGRRASESCTPSIGARSDTSKAPTNTPIPHRDGRTASPAGREPDRRLSRDRQSSISEVRQMNIRGHDIDTRSEGGTSNISIRSKGTGHQSVEDDPPLLTARFKHVVTEGGHAVITGRGGETLQRCEDEPIHIPGAVQSFGLVVAIREEEGKFLVRVVSENSKNIIGYTPQQLFALSSFLDIFTEEQADNLLDNLDFIRDEEADTSLNGPEVFMVTLRPPHRRTQKLWCAMHINDTNKDLIICEFELEDDIANPQVPGGESTPETPKDTLSVNPTPEEYAESTINKSKPLRVLRSAREKKGEAAAMEVFNVLSQVQEQLANAPDLELFLKVLIGVVKELTGFHRVMIYQFDRAWNGRVVAELIDPRATKDLYMGLNFPASDIPKQARDLYRINKVRLLYDKDQETSRLVCRTMEDLENPLDLTHSYLRAMSPIHIKYLANMAVRSSMSISIDAFNELWGLIACHTYGQKGMRVSFPIRKMCRLVGDTASRNIERLSCASRLQARKLINTISTEANPGGYIIASSKDLLKLFDADCGALSIRDETKILGKPEQTQEILALLEYLRVRKFRSVMTTQHMAMDFPDLRYPPGFHHVAGLLYVPLSSAASDFIVFFRKGQLREVKWAGNPYEKFIKEGTEGYLEPRKSFRLWSETIAGRCKDWTEEQVETAAVLCLVYGKFIEVWRMKETALQNSQLTRLLLANSAHEVRTPLHQIVNFLEIALEGNLDQDTREALSKSHSASKSLIYVINDLLDLTKTEEGKDLIRDETFDLAVTVKEATDMFQGEAKRKKIDYEVEMYPGLPQLVVGDQRRVRQVISNVIANAIQHTAEGSVRVEVWVSQQLPERMDIEFGVQDTGIGMSSAKLDALFQALEQVSTEEDEAGGSLSPATQAITKADNDERTLGLGLAIVARLLRLMNGQMRLKSEEGKGSRFVIQLSFDLPEGQKSRSITEGAFPAHLNSGLDLPVTPPATEGEILLINRSAQKRASRSPMLRRQESSESIKSAHSTKGSIKSTKSQASQRSDVERLIDAIQEPHMLVKSQEEDANPLSRPSRKTSMERRSKAERAYSVSLMGESSPARHHSKGYDLNTMREEFAIGLSVSRDGEERVTDSRTPIKPVRIPEDESAFSSLPLPSKLPSKVMFEMPDRPLSAENLHILVAEDDPINSRIVKKRLEKMGHEVHLTVNGEECAFTHGEECTQYDVVLMDIQMPIVDGMTSTKMIRSFEKTHAATHLSKRASLNGRIPIFAVSASLVERERQKYVDTGFDGWILKPIDFKRVAILLAGLVEEETRRGALYRPGQWERGGWFEMRKTEPFTNTTPSDQPPILANRLAVTSPEEVPTNPIDSTHQTDQKGSTI